MNAPGSRLARTALMWIVVASLAVALGSALGWLSWRFWVIGLAGLVLGLGVGWAFALVRAWLGIAPRPWVVIIFAIVLGWAALQQVEDGNQRRAYRVVLAETRAADTGLPPAEITRLMEAGGLDYLADDGDAILEQQVEQAIGFGAITGRWLFRAQDGVRLAGSWRESRGLRIGTAGAIVAALLELALAILLALRIAKRAAP